MSDEATLQAESQPAADSAVPLGSVGTNTGRDRSGRFVVGNTAALVVGHRSRQFWAQHAAALADISRAILADAGFSKDDAPEALRQAAAGVAQATLIRDAAFEWLAESAGPLTIKEGRGRRAFAVWDKASTLLERHLRLVGLHRTSRPALSFVDAVHAASARARGDDADDSADIEVAEGEPEPDDHAA